MKGTEEQSSQEGIVGDIKSVQLHDAFQWKKLSSKVLYEHARVTLVEDCVELPNGHQSQYLRFENIGDAVTIICVKDNKVLLEREYSYPVGKVMWQFPGGVVDKPESLEAAANRELMEEVGYRSNNLTYLGKYFMNNRRSSACMHAFLAKDLIEKSLDTGDIEEKIEKEWLAVDELRRMISSNEIANMHVLASWCLYENMNAFLNSQMTLSK